MKTMLDFTNKIKPYFQGVAKVEPTTTAAAAHSKGERFYLDGTLVEATADIAVGATMAVGTNVKLSPNVISKLDAIGNVSGNPKTVPYANVVSIEDGIAVNAKDVNIKIEPIQAGSGTPSPSNVRAISGRSVVTVTRAGKNLVDLSVTESGGIDADGNYVDSQGGTLWRMKQNAFINVQPNEKYSCRWTEIEQKLLTTFRIYYYDKDKNYLYRQDFNAGTVKTFTIPSNAYFIKWTTYTVAGSVTQDIVESYQIQIEIGETATAYEPYTGNDYTIDLGGTIYGGTLDVTTGVLTVDRKFIDLGTLDWSVAIAAISVFSTAPISDIKIPMSAAEREEGIISSNYPVSSKYVLDNMDDKSMLKHENGRLYIRDTSYSDATLFKTAMAGVQFVYEVETPTTIQLTPTQIRMLAGVNTVYADTGDTQLEYFYASVGNVGEVLGDVQEDTKGLTENAFENGAVNLLDNKATSQSINGLTVVVNDDKSLTVNGTASDNTQIYITVNSLTDFLHLDTNKEYKVSGCPAGGNTNTYSFMAQTYASTSYVNTFVDAGNGVVARLNSGEAFRVIIGIKKNAVCNNLIFKPMITVADMPNSDYAHYVPYAKSNKELTEDVTTLQNNLQKRLNWTLDTDIATTIINNWNSLPKGAPFMLDVYASGHNIVSGYIYPDGNYGFVTATSLGVASSYLVQKYNGTYSKYKMNYQTI